MQKSKVKSVKRVKSFRATKKVPMKKEKVHTFFELYLHGLAGVVGLGILVIPLFVALVYGGIFSIYLVVGAGFLAMLIGMLIYDISITHNHDPYNFLKTAIKKEYSFIFAFLLLISFIITIIAAGVASVGELSLFFGLSPFTSIAVIDLLFVVMWIVIFYNKIRRTLNFAGALKIFFVILLIILGATALFYNRASSVSGVQTSYVLPVSAPLFLFGMLILLWMYGGFEGASIVYKGENRVDVAKALLAILITAIILFALIQTFVFTSENSASVGNLIYPILLSMPTANIFTANILSAPFGTGVEDIIVGLSIVVILLTAFALINVSNRTLDDVSRDGLMPAFLQKDENLKLLITSAIPIVLITIFAPVIVDSGVFSYLSLIIVSALSFAAAFAFFSFGYGYAYLKKRNYSRALFGFFVFALLLALIVTSPVPFLIGLIIILIVAIIGYALVK
jgi:amino acid transporter